MTTKNESFDNFEKFRELSKEYVDMLSQVR